MATDPSSADLSTDLSADYAHAGFGGTVGWGDRPAILVIDVCRAYVDEQSPLFHDRFVTASQACARLVAAGRAAGIPVLFTRVEFEPGGADGGVFYRKVPALACFDRGNPLAEFLHDPAPEPGDVVVTKQYASAFFGTSLAATLTARGIDTVVICGLSTSGCVRATGVDACQHGFRPIVVDEACGDRDAAVHAANLFDLGAKYADVVPLEEAIARLG